MTSIRSSMFRRSIASTLALSLSIAGGSVPVHAAVIGTEAATAPIATPAVVSGQARLQAALSRADVVDILTSRGVDPDAARARAAMLTDAEAAELAQGIDQAPAGGINALAAVAIVFGVLVITDILGFTRVFSFTSPIK
jgi:hypothetical protein